MIAGPCAIESRAQIELTAKFVASAGAAMIRGGAYKPRTSPYAFQGLGEEAVKLMADASRAAGIPAVVEALAETQLLVLDWYVDMIQIGARNMQNFTLLQAAARTGKPVLLKRAPFATLDEVLYAAEYILVEGNPNVVLCERGITTFEDAARYTTDINAIPILKGLTHLPVFLDPSHATGAWGWVKPIALAGVAAGADGLIVEVHPDPQHAKSDGKQSLKPARFVELMDGIAKVAEAVGRNVRTGLAVA